MLLRPRRVRAAAISVAAGGSLLLAGCGIQSPEVCPLVGYSQTLTVRIEGEPARGPDVQAVLVCGGGECIDPAPSMKPSIVSAERSSEEPSAWLAALVDTEQELLIRAVGTDGSVLSERHVAPDWRRIGGSPRCEGPTAAEVTLSL